MIINGLVRLELRDDFNRIGKQSFEAFDIFHQMMQILLLMFELRMMVFIEGIL
jgi:hypothetical protein